MLSLDQEVWAKTCIEGDGVTIGLLVLSAVYANAVEELAGQRELRGEYL